MLFDIERELFSLQRSEENSLVSSMGRRPGLSINEEISRLDFLKLVHVLLMWRVVLDVMNAQFIVCKHVFESLAVKKTGLVHGDHG